MSAEINTHHSPANGFTIVFYSKKVVGLGSLKKKALETILTRWQGYCISVVSGE